jgi:phosphoglycerate dehydrogenase-like enzyme
LSGRVETPFKIVFLDGHTLAISDDAFEPFHRHRQCTIYDPTPMELVHERANSADIILTNFKTLINADTLSRLDRLNFIAVTGTIAGAAIDVVTHEPIHQDNPLLTAKNCILAPHIAWAATEFKGRLIQSTAENIAPFIPGRLSML